MDSDGGTRGMSTKAVVSTKTVLWVEMEVMAAVRGWTWKWTWKGNEKGQWKVKVEEVKWKVEVEMEVEVEVEMESESGGTYGYIVRVCVVRVEVLRRVAVFSINWLFL